MIELTSVALLLAGFSFLVYPAFHWRLIRSRDWETTEGRVVSVETCDTAEKAGAPYELVVLYVYIVEGIERHSQYDGRFGDESQRDNVAGEYQPDQKIIVHYDPADPNISWINKREHKEPRQSLITGVVLIAAGIIVFAFAVYLA